MQWWCGGLLLLLMMMTGHCGHIYEEKGHSRASAAGGPGIGAWNEPRLRGEGPCPSLSLFPSVIATGRPASECHPP
jgi:hypothetical protein